MNGLYTAGQAAGTFWVIAACSCANPDTANVKITQPTATLLSLQLTPPGAILRTGRTRQFYVSGVWSDSGRGAPPVSWTATGGAISNDGKYTAGSIPGTFQVIATEQAGT